MNNKPTFRSSKLLKSGENYETSLSLATPIHDVQVLGQREENQRFENGLGFMAKILAALFKVLPFKFWLVCGLCSTTIGFYLVRSLHELVLLIFKFGIYVPDLSIILLENFVRDCWTRYDILWVVVCNKVSFHKY